MNHARYDWHLTDLNIYPAAIVLVPLHHHLKFFIDLRIFGLGARGKIVFDCIGFRTLRRHGTLMFLLVERLQVSADRFTWPHRPRALNLHMHVNLTPRRAFLISTRFTLAITFHAEEKKREITPLASKSNCIQQMTTHTYMHDILLINI